MKSIATTPIKYGTPKDGIVEYAVGDTLDLDKKTTEQLTAAGAVTIAAGKGGKSAAEKAEEERLATEAAIAEANALADADKAAAAEAERKAIGGV